MTRDDVTGFYAAHYGPADSALVLVGDFTEPEAHTLAERYFGKWAWQGHRQRSRSTPSPAAKSTHIVIIDKPGLRRQRSSPTASDYLSPRQICRPCRS